MISEGQVSHIKMKFNKALVKVLCLPRTEWKRREGYILLAIGFLNGLLILLLKDAGRKLNWEKYPNYLRKL